jgi:hypothetical protein
MIYVTVEDGDRFGVLVGPFETPAQAEPWVPAARAAAAGIDPDTNRYGFGISLLRGESSPGRLNRRVGYAPPGNDGTISPPVDSGTLPAGARVRLSTHEAGHTVRV